MKLQATTIVTPHKTFKLSSDESLLDGLLRTGHQVEYQCRNGYCGACRCKLVSGKVSYPTLPLAFIPAGEVLTCCGKAESTLELDLPMMEIENLSQAYILNHSPTDATIALLRIKEKSTQIVIDLATSNPTIITIPIGFEGITESYFRHIPPTPDEIEYAINDIEDEIEKIVPLVSNTLVLYTSEPFIYDIASLCGVESKDFMVLHRDVLERLFGEFAASATGRPLGLGNMDIKAVFYAQLLIFRELMHHLKFDAIHIFNYKNE